MYWTFLGFMVFSLTVFGGGFCVGRAFNHPTPLTTKIRTASWVEFYVDALGGERKITETTEEIF